VYTWSAYHVTPIRLFEPLFLFPNMPLSIISIHIHNTICLMTHYLGHLLRCPIRIRMLLKHLFHNIQHRQQFLLIVPSANKLQANWGVIIRGWIPLILNKLLDLIAGCGVGGRYFTIGRELSNRKNNSCKPPIVRKLSSVINRTNLADPTSSSESCSPTSRLCHAEEPASRQLGTKLRQLAALLWCELEYHSSVPALSLGTHPFQSSA
jgi:hypothetical protein